jgi:NADPH:quinone reductase-like Zn-dependent oxidoreductase
VPKIVRFYELGGPEVLKIEDAPSLEPGPGEVKLRVEAVGLNRAESMYYHGRYLEQVELPSRIGYEVAGVVEAVGAGVDPAWIGKKTATVPGYSMNRYGGLGEEAIVPLEVLGEYPATLSPVQGAAIWMQYLTAYGALVTVGGVKPGDFVSIPAASSSVGLAAIQIVKAEGATAIAATRTSAKRAELLALGADRVVATGEEDYVARVGEITGGKGVRLTFDPVGGPFIEKLAAAAAPGGIISAASGVRKFPEHSRLLPRRGDAESGGVRNRQEVCLRPAGGRALCAQDRQDLSLGPNCRRVSLPRIQPAGGQDRDYRSVVIRGAGASACPPIPTRLTRPRLYGRMTSEAMPSERRLSPYILSRVE